MNALCWHVGDVFLRRSASGDGHNVPSLQKHLCKLVCIPCDRLIHLGEGKLNYGIFEQYHNCWAEQASKTDEKFKNNNNVSMGIFIAT